MLTVVNQKIGALWGACATALARVAGPLLLVLRAALQFALGEWRAPAWLRLVGRALAAVLNWCRWHGAQVLILLALGAAIWFNLPLLKRWWQGLIPDQGATAELSFKVHEPSRTRIEDQLPPEPLVVSFSGHAAPLIKVGKPATDIEMDPPAAGQWTWSDADHLSFQPKEDWPVGQRYTVKLGRKALAANVKLKEREFSFSAPAFEITVDSGEFYQDPVQVNLRRVVYQLRFSHPVNTQKLEANLRLDLGDPDKPFLGIGQAASRKFVVSYDKFKLQATVMSEPLPIPDQTQSMRLTVAAGVTAQRGGPGTDKDVVQSVDVPGLYSLAIADISASVVSNQTGDPEHVLHVGTSMAVHERELARVVSAWVLPESDKPGGEPTVWSDPNEVTPAVLQRATPLKLEPIAGEREVSEGLSFRMPQAEGGRFIYVKVAKGLKTPGGYLLGTERADVMQLKTFAPELSIVSQGSLLALSGDKKLPILVRDLPGVQVEIARMLPQQLHMLMSQSSGDFSKPNFYQGVTPDHLAERFERKIPLKLKPGRSHYETVDFGEYLKTDGGERRGIFLLTVKGYDPKNDTNAPVVDQSDQQQDEGSYGGRYEGEGAEGSDMPNPESMEDKRLVLVTDLGLLAKRTIDGSRDVYVQSISTGLPVGQATVEVWGRNGLVLVSQTTDATGHVRVPNLAGFQREKTPVMLVVRKEGDLSFLPFNRHDRNLDVSRFDVGGIQSAGVPNQMTAYLFSDRGIYRPGDTLHIGIIVKAGNWATSLKDMPVEAEVVDARGMVVRREVIKLDAGGVAELAHTTQDSSPTGNYSINLSLPRQSSPGAPEVPALQLGSTSVKVQEFLPDRTKVTAKLSSESADGWVSPDGLKAMVSVQNLFGTPAQHRRVSGTLTLRPAYPSFRAYPDYSFYDDLSARQTHVDELGDQESDAQGAATFDLRLERFESATYQAHVLVKAFEPEGGRSVAAEVRTLVSDRPYLVGTKAQADLSYVTRNAVRDVDVIAIDPRVKLMAVSGLKLVRLEHRTLSVLVKQGSGLYRYESRAKDVTLEELPYAIGAKGNKLRLNTATPGNFAYQLRDENGLVLARVEYSVAGAANLSRSLDRNAELQIKLNKKDYNPGEDIELSIQAPYTGAGLITIERDKVYTHTWFKTDKTASVQKITLPKDFEGNGYVSVHFIRDPASDEIYTSPLSYGVVPFATSLAKRTANIKLSSNELLKPGETLKMTLQSDKPTKAFVFAVDEGILQVARYNNPDPLKHFFDKRALEVSTLQTLDLILPEFKKLMQGAAPGGDGEGALGKHLNPFKRKRDKPVAYWSGLVDVQGSREFSYTVPESFNGALRVIAVAVNDDAAAVATTKATVRGDLILLPNVPLAISPGDVVEVGVGLANNIAGSGKNAAIKLNLAVNGGLEVVGDSSRTLNISERDEASTVFRVRARADAQAQLGSASVIFTAQRGGSNARLSTDVSVRPASAHVTLVQSGTLVGSGELKSKATVYPQLAHSELAVSASPWAFASGLMQYLEQYPYGCTEQISSRTVPAVLMLSRPELAKEVARGRSAAEVAAIDPQKSWRNYLTQLRSRQNGDGGMGAWPGSGSDVYATVQAMQVLLEARERKLAVPADMLSKASDYLQGQLGSGGGNYSWAWRGRAQSAYLLTRQGVLVPAALANLREGLRAKWGSDARLNKDLGAVYLAASYQLLKQDAAANELLDPVWNELLERMKTRQSRQVWDGYYDPLVHDSTLIYLVARHFPKRLGSLPTDTWEVLARMIRAGWYNSASSASTIWAVDAYASAAAQSAKGQIKVSALNAQGVAQPLTLGELQPMARTTVPQGSAKLKLSTGGSLPLFYAWAESGFERGVPDKPLSQGMEIIHEVLNDKGQVITEARLGDEVTVRVRVRSLDRASIPQVALVDVLPGGLEPVQNPVDATEQTDEPLWRRRLGGSGNWSLDFADIREDRVLFFGTVNKSMMEISYKARATNTGEFTMPAAYGEAMYERRLFARSAGGRFTVKPVAPK
ncbi:alpha-2-macroglobulin [Aquabacterium sp. NJ1]|uniref:alpha-2-macroglobulin family protein n=1 Tax=Aquabacterium sp. NJ1 TaxID=1538295 RepID=UPI00052D9857|nr:alpha-2-macroglobulin [Aquabacterium sp. NJ1]KGM40530.1 alpha-2-macroglobulin [Aquabacterium sp. NJ1]